MTDQISETEYDLDEESRLAALSALDVLDSDPEPAFDGIVEAVSIITGCPIAMVSLMERDRQWYKARCGIGMAETPRDIAFCKHTVDGRTAIEVLDMTKDPRFKDHPFVRGEESIRYYLGIPVKGPTGGIVGTICAIDRKPRKATDPAVISALEGLAHTVEHLLSARWLARTQQAKLETLAAEAKLEAEHSDSFAGEADELPMSDEVTPAPRAWVNRLTRDFGSDDAAARRNQWDAVVNAAVRGLRPMASNQQLKLDVAVETINTVRPPVIFARIVFSLLQRALELARPKTEISIELSRTAGFIRLKVGFVGEDVEQDPDAARWMRTVGGILNVETDDDHTDFVAWFPTS